MLLKCSPTTKLWECLISNAIVVEKLSKFLKLVEIAIIMVFGNMEDERTFSMIRLIKSKFYNYLTTHLDLVVKMYAQQFYKLETFPLLIECHKLENLIVEFGKLQRLVEFDLSNYFKLGCLIDSIVDLSQLKTFRLQGCHKLKNLPMEFGKLESLVKLDLFSCFKLGHLFDSIVDLSQLKTFGLSRCHELENLLM
jgi:hypothetical protein